jgi:simple sugar transport system permease protein
MYPHDGAKRLVKERVIKVISGKDINTIRKSKLTKPFDYLYQSPWAIVILSFFIALAIVLGICSLFEIHPRGVILALFEGAVKGKAFESTLEQIAPFCLATLAAFVPLTVGFFNVGGEGQLWVGALAAVFVTLNYQGPPVLVIPLALLLAAIAGVVAVIIPLILKLRLGGAIEVTATIVTNFICMYFVMAQFTGAMKDPTAFYGTTYPVPQMFRLPVISLLGINVQVGIVFAIMLVIGIYLLIKYTVYGIQLRAIGFNREFAAASGVSINKVFISATLGGAALAGLAGGLYILGSFFRVSEGWSLGWGWSGLGIALLTIGIGNALAIIPLAFGYAILGTGGLYMQALLGLPGVFFYIVQNLPVLVFLILRAGLSLRKGLAPT